MARDQAAMSALGTVDLLDDVIATEDEGSSRAAMMDHHVGSRIRERRTMLGISQQQLAQTIGVTYQQAHKYERGLNRISAGRLYEIALALSVNVNWFFEGLADEPLPAELTARQRMCLELARNFAAIDNAKHQEALSQLARALAAQSAPRRAAADGAVHAPAVAAADR
jgi:transcriptional regulator with XRE-family HTH domain